MKHSPERKLDELIAGLRSDRALSRSQRQWLADALDPKGKSTFRFELKQRRRGRINRVILDGKAFEAGEYVYSKVTYGGGGQFESVVEDAIARYELGRTKIIENYSRAKKAKAPAKPLSFFDGTATDAEREAYEAGYDAWRERAEAELREAETEVERAEREADYQEWRKESEAEYKAWLESKNPRSDGPGK